MNTSKKIPAGGGRIYYRPTIEITSVNTEKGFCESNTYGSVTHEGIGEEYGLGN